MGDMAKTEGAWQLLITVVRWACVVYFDLFLSGGMGLIKPLYLLDTKEPGWLGLETE